ncbi:hypothetical protein SADUNF_Sadunf03G0142400 [Salix dunnii]|uniref:Uncharacterized protein n=1 Tax=Salix dunnii TaxID=1413687 RepID=A0A835TEA1_9ROSI|nr:hypothetical protein SADUNF_Sadunf03G0142400 [Salix dunnii]
MTGSAHESPAIPSNTSEEGKGFSPVLFRKEVGGLFQVLALGNGRNLYVLDALAEVERSKCRELDAAGNVPTKNVTTPV